MKTRSIVSQLVLSVCLSVLALSSFAESKSQPQDQAKPAPIQEGKDYNVLPKEMAKGPAANANPKKTQVLEFFSYGCPACYSVEAPFDAWTKQQNPSVVVKKVPVTFFPGWDDLARAYYMETVLGIKDKINGPLFKAIHEDRISLTNEDELKNFFEKHGVSAETFDKNFHSFPVARLMLEGNELQKHYQITAVPAVVVASRYKTDLSMTKGDVERFIETINFLVKKHQEEVKRGIGEKK